MSTSPECHHGTCGINCERGGALIELSIFLPLLVVLAVLATNFGVLLNERQMLVEAARYGARRAAGSGLPDCEPIFDGGGFSKPDPNKRGNPHAPLNGVQCVDALANENVFGLSPVAASDLGNFYGCHFLQQAGLDIGDWMVKSTVVQIGVAPNEGSAVRLRIFPNDSRTSIVSSLMGDSFPSAAAEFSISRTCGSDIITATGGGSTG